MTQVEDRLRVAEQLYARCIANGEGRKGLIVKNAIEQAFQNDNAAYLHALQAMRHVPVTIDEFLDSTEFLGGMIETWPLVREDLRTINPDWMTGASPKLTVLLAGATGTGKSVIGQVSLLYVTYWLTCFRQPQRLFGLSPYTPIVLVIQSPQFERVTKRVLYEPMRQMFTDMGYTKRWVDYNRYKESSLVLDGRVELAPSLASVQAIQGQAIIAALIDEINFMSVVEHSKQTSGPQGLGGHYDQAETLYTTLSRRRKSRFRTKGPNPGGMMLSSSVHYKGDFMDRRVDEALEQGQKYNGVVIRRKQYEAQPEGTFSEQKFRLLVGTNDYPTRVLSDHEVAGEHYPTSAQIEMVPVDYEEEFERDPENALRDICGLASGAITRFMSQYHKVTEAVVRGRERKLKSWVEEQNVDLAKHGMPRIIEENLPNDRDKPRTVHVDLSKVNDRCGIAIVKVEGHIMQPTGAGTVDNLPKLVAEALITIQPSPSHELDIAEVRKWIMLLITYYGFNIRAWSYDGFQSTESIQILRRAGINVEEISMDRNTDAYDNVKALFYDDRIDMIENDIVQGELVNLEKHVPKSERAGRKAYVDHPPKGSKDGADALAGAAWTATRLRTVRTRTGQVDRNAEAVGIRQSGRGDVSRREVRRR